MLLNAPTYEEVFNEFLKWLEEIHNELGGNIQFISHRSHFESSFLERYFSLIGKEFPSYVSREVVDSIDAATFILGSSQKSISKLCKIFDINPGGDQHTAPRDVFLENKILDSIFSLCYPNDKENMFLKWAENSKKYDPSSLFFKQRISFENSRFIHFFPQDLLKHQLRLFGAPQSSSDINNKKWKEFQKNFGEDFKNISFESVDVDKLENKIKVRQFGKNGWKSFLETASKYRDIHYNKNCFCDECTEKNKEQLTKMVLKIGEKKKREKDSKEVELEVESDPSQISLSQQIVPLKTPAKKIPAKKIPSKKSSTKKTSTKKSSTKKTLNQTSSQQDN